MRVEQNYINKLSTTEKAHLLFTIFPEELEFFKLTVQVMIENIYKNQSAFKNEWKEKQHAINLHAFLAHAKHVKIQLDYNRKQINNSIEYLAGALFNEQSQVFSLYCLRGIICSMSDNSKYIQVANLFFFQQQEKQ